MAVSSQTLYDDKLYREGARSGLYGSLPASVIEDPSLGIAEKTILAFFVTSCGKRSECHEKQSTTMSLLGLSKSTYKRGLASLKRQGYITLCPLLTKSGYYDPAHKVGLTKKTKHQSKRYVIAYQNVIWSSLSYPAKALYLVITCKEDTADIVDLPVEWLAYCLGASKNTVIKYMTELVEYGLIERTTKKRDGETRQFIPSQTIIKHHPCKAIPLPCPPALTEATEVQKPERKKPRPNKRRSYKKRNLSSYRNLSFGVKTINDCLLTAKETTKKEYPEGTITRETIQHHKLQIQTDYEEMCRRYPSQRIPTPTDAEIDQLVADRVAQDTSFHGIAQIPAFEKKHDLFAYLHAHVDATEETALFVIRATEALLTQTAPIRLPDGKKITAEEFRKCLNKKIIQNHWRSGQKLLSNSGPVADVSALMKTLEDYAEHAAASMEFNAVRNPVAYTRAIILADVGAE